MKNGKILEKNDIKKFDKNNLDIILDYNKAPREPEREVYDIEKDKIDEWKSEIKKQDEILLDVGKDIKKLKINAKEISKSIDLNEKMIKKTQNHADKTDVDMKRSNKQLKDILEKVGGPTNFCVDVVLVCVCLGLCAVLYNIMKSRL
jgi:chromosome segregation ATPase